MKINILKSIIVLGIGLLIGWGFLAGSEDTDTGLIMAIIVCICLLIAGEIMFGNGKALCLKLQPEAGLFVCLS